MELMQRIKGGLYGVAVGDALGGTTEFMSPSEIKAQYGYLNRIIGGGVWRLEAGEVTDDTMMTICVAAGILDQPDQPYSSIGDYFLQWYQSKPKDIGNIILGVFSTYQGNWFEAAYLIDLELGRSAGNGSLMRCLPIGLVYPSLPQLEQVSHMHSKMTHYDDRASEACRIYNRIVYRLLQGEELRESIVAEIADTMYQDVPDEGPACEPSGFVVHTLRWVIHLLLTSDSFSEVIERAANEGGDSDTIAAIAGGLAGVYYGFDAIPSHYADQLLIQVKLDDLAGRMLKLREQLAAISE